MGQYWKLFNPDRRHVVTLGTGGLRLGEGFFVNSHHQIYRFLRLPSYPRELNKWLARGPEALQPGRLANLPEEILRIIFDELDLKFVGLAIVACTCKRLLASVMSILRPWLEATHAPWAKCRIICLGDGTYHDDDLPAGFLTGAEKLEAATIPDDIPDACAPGYFRYADDQYEGSFFNTSSYDSNELRQHEIVPRVIQERTIDPSTGAQDVAIFSAIHRTVLVGGRARDMDPPVLFNLTKGECVREDGLCRTTRGSRGWHRGRMDLMHALISRICWSSCLDSAMWLEDWLEEQLTRGPWAGDRFYITTMEDAGPLAPTGEPWKDVTEEVDTFLWHVWRHARKGDPLCGEEFKDVPGGDPSTAAKREAVEEAKEAQEAA